MNITAIIPARGGSKAIPQKNIKLLCGKPLIAYTIEEAKKSKYISSIIVSTDDNEIKNVALKYGAKIHNRSPDTAKDDSPSEDALLECINSMPKQPDILVFLQCTSPFTTIKDIDGTIEKLIAEQADCAFAVTPFHYFLWSEDGNGINHDKRIRNLRQNKKPQYLEAGSVYVMKTNGFIKHKHRFFGKVSLYIMPKDRVFEIDEPWDFELAQIIMEKRNVCKNNS